MLTKDLAAAEAKKKLSSEQYVQVREGQPYPYCHRPMIQRHTPLGHKIVVIASLLDEAGVHP
ncbi:MAG: hypothetical protein NTZ17_14435 [Phycisphaerae bacterium]|nr:hypothetical protein [Phycisphaerae bacterium]